MQIHKQRRVLPDDVRQDPQLDQAAHHPNSPVPHQHLARGLILKEEVGNGICDLFLHLLSSADPEGGGSLMCPTCIKTAGSACADVSAVTTTNVWSSWSREVWKRTSYFSLSVLPLPPTLSLSLLFLSDFHRATLAFLICPSYFSHHCITWLFGVMLHTKQMESLFCFLPPSPARNAIDPYHLPEKWQHSLCYQFKH